MRYPGAQDNGIRNNRHTAEMRYPEAQTIAKETQCTKITTSKHILIVYTHQ